MNLDQSKKRIETQIAEKSFLVQEYTRSIKNKEYFSPHAIRAFKMHRTKLNKEIKHLKKLLK